MHHFYGHTLVIGKFDGSWAYQTCCMCTIDTVFSLKISGCNMVTQKVWLSLCKEFFSLLILKMYTSFYHLLLCFVEKL